MKSLMASWSFMGMVAGQPTGLWLWLNPFTSPLVLAETTATACTAPSTWPLVKVAMVGPARELGWVQQQQQQQRRQRRRQQQQQQQQQRRRRRRREEEEEEEEEEV